MANTSLTLSTSKIIELLFSFNKSFKNLLSLDYINSKDAPAHGPLQHTQHIIEFLETSVLSNLFLLPTPNPIQLNKSNLLKVIFHLILFFWFGRTMLPTKLFPYSRRYLSPFRTFSPKRDTNYQLLFIETPFS